MHELTFTLDNNSKKPLYEQLYRYIKDEIRAGAIPFGERLPSTRRLSGHLQISRSTVELAYDQLVSEGYIESVPYKGYFVCKVEGLYHLSGPKAETAPKFNNEQPSYDYDFSPNGIDLESFPFGVWRKLSKNILIDDKKEIFQPGSPKGEHELRLAVHRYLHQARGVNCSPEQIIVGAGNDYLLMLLSHILDTEGRVAMESPTYKQAYRVFTSLGYRVTPVTVDKAGINMAGLNGTDADIVYAMPSHQFPLGIVMPLKRRMELLDWASARDGRYIIEDDYDSEFRYIGKPIPALQGYDDKDKVIYIGTFSKSIAPAIRISYMVLPKNLLVRYEKEAAFFSSTVSRIDQMIVQHFLADGHYERHLNKMRTIYRGKHDALLEAMKIFGSSCKISGANAGLHVLARINSRVNEQEMIRQAEQNRIRVYGLQEYDIDKADTAGVPTFLMGYANMSEGEIEAAVALLHKVWKEYL